MKRHQDPSKPTDPATLGALFGQLVDRVLGPRTVRPEDRQAFVGLFGEGSDAMQREAVAAVRGEVRAWAALLALLHRELLRSATAIEPTPFEADPDVDLDRMDEPTEVRSIVRNVAESYLRPAIDALQTLVGEG